MMIDKESRTMIMVTLALIVPVAAGAVFMGMGGNLGDVFDIVFYGGGCCCKISANEGAAAGSLKTLNGMFATYRKKGYSELGHTFPVGNDPAVPNNGSFAGLYYEVNGAGECVTLIGAAEAGADCRADGDTDTCEDDGSYLPSLYQKEAGASEVITFSCRPKQGYWYGLMKYCRDGNTVVPYDKNYSKYHFALAAFPCDYGSSGEVTFIINEEGTVYYQDMGYGKYIETWPGPDPTEYGWELAE